VHHFPSFISARLRSARHSAFAAALAATLLSVVAAAVVVAAHRSLAEPAAATAFEAVARDPRMPYVAPRKPAPRAPVHRHVAAPPKPRPHRVVHHVARPKPRPKPRPDRLAALRGLSAWVDLYDYGKAGPAAAAQLADVAAAHGVSTLWVETSRYNTANIEYPAALAALMDRAAVRHIRVIAWVLPEFRSVSADLAKARAAAAFRSSRGHRFADLGLDIEVSSGAKASDRSSRLLAMASALHGHIGMPLIAITPPPVGFSKQPTYWPGFPWRSLAARSDAVATMGYWSYSHDADPGAYTSTVLQQTRQLIGRSSYPIHVIGGLAADTTAAGAAAFCRAARSGHALGASLYDLTSTPAALWQPLQACRSVGH
jgi:hypothetical protein